MILEFQSKKIKKQKAKEVINNISLSIINYQLSIIKKSPTITGRALPIYAIIPNSLSTSSIHCKHHYSTNNLLHSLLEKTQLAKHVFPHQLLRAQPLALKQG